MEPLLWQLSIDFYQFPLPLSKHTRSIWKIPCSHATVLLPGETTDFFCGFTKDRPFFLGPELSVVPPVFLGSIRAQKTWITAGWVTRGPEPFPILFRGPDFQPRNLRGVANQKKHLWTCSNKKSLYWWWCSHKNFRDLPCLTTQYLVSYMKVISH